MRTVIKAAKVRLLWLAILLAAVATGWALATNTVIRVPDTLVLLLISIGLYAAATGIKPKEARKDARLIGLAVTLGVVAKGAIVAGLCFVATRLAGVELASSISLSLAVGVVFSQIDPLSVDALESSSRMSGRAKHVVRAWACYDDPVSVLLARYVVPLLAAALGGIALTGTATSLTGWAVQLVLNAAAVGSIFGVWHALRKLPWQIRTAAEVALLLAVLTMGTVYGLTLAVAVAGLFLRPLPDVVVTTVVRVAYVIAAMLVGTLLVGGASLGLGMAVGIFAYLAHAIVAELLGRTERLDARDRRHLRLAQQSGITACSLVLLFAAALPTLAAICAVAIVTVNALHLGANTALDWSESRLPAPATPAAEG